MWGCLAKVAIPDPKKVKIRPKTVDCVFIGYATNSSAYRFLVHKSDISDIHINTIIKFRNASFFEDIFPCKDVPKMSCNKRTHDMAMDHLQNKVSEDEPRYSKRTKVAKLFCPNFLTFLLESEPKTFKEVMSTLKAPFWKKAINSEIESIMQNHTWEIVDLTSGIKPLG